MHVCYLVTKKLALGHITYLYAVSWIGLDQVGVGEGAEPAEKEGKKLV